MHGCERRAPPPPLPATVLTAFELRTTLRSRFGVEPAPQSAVLLPSLETPYTFLNGAAVPVPWVVACVPDPAAVDTVYSESVIMRVR